MVKNEYPDQKERGSIKKIFWWWLLWGSEVSHSALIYVSGYVAYKMAHKWNCQQCINMFVSESPVDNDYFWVHKFWESESTTCALSQTWT